MEPLYIIKIGGNIIDDETKLDSFLHDFARIDAPKILVHGGGKLATRMADQLQVPQQLVEGRRITDAETLRIVTMVYAGYINKQIVAKLQGFQCNAFGLCGADGNAIQAHKRIHATIDYGFAGDVDRIDVNLLQTLLNSRLTLVIAPITHDRSGQLLNTNADTIAQETARALGMVYDVRLIYSFEKRGVLLDANDDATVIPKINPAYYSELKANGKIFAGMIPKLDNAFAAVASGVRQVIIGRAENITALVAGKSGTTISND